ncbi:oligosaccharide flippase family protein [Psychrobacter sp. CMS30]|uniref:oligosaccharide flippase family protein n=1 Tax=Psychrobacter sp. CMS30 TaxID=2774126 RepID=UPI0027DE7CC2|nr:oligosaccharide flippase family protein [Psychrobacter sp. CMS30]
MEYIYLVPLSIWMASTSLALQYWLIRVKRFEIIAQSKVSRSIGGSAIQLIGGLYGMLTLGLIYGQIIIHGAGVTRQGYSILRKDIKLIKQFRFSEILPTFKKYKYFSCYSSLGALFNSVSTHAPILIIAAFAVSAEAGYLMLATRVLSSPISLIGTSVGQVFTSSAAEEYRAGRLGELAKRNIIGLIKIGVGPLIFLTIVAPFLFKILFGEEWIRAGEIVRWMTPWIIMQFLCAPITTSLQIIRKENIAFRLNVFGFFIRTGIVLISALIFPLLMVEMYAISSFMFYTAYFFTITHMIGLSLKDVAACIKGSSFILSFWVIFSFVTYAILKVLGDIWHLV